MKRALMITAIALAAMGYAFREQILAVAAELLTANMFVASDSDTFDPGLDVGTDFPPVRAIHAGSELQSIDEFMGTRGTVFYANRSVDW